MGGQNNSTLHFTFGSPQTFVSQARRTRDLWAGSYLLSWLAGHGMHALGKEKVLMPDIRCDALMEVIEAVKNGSLPTKNPEIGSLPNRFVATLPDSESGDDCVRALNEEWERIAKTILAHINRSEKLLDEAEGSIWHRQVKSVWECTWVLGDEGYLLDQRKNLRNHLPESEPGEKCTVCGERQELSGKTDPRQIRTEIKEWWQAKIRDKVHELDLRENERLCAVCLIKRAVPFASKAIFGWEIPRFYPSTAYMAVIDWLIEMLRYAAKHEHVKDAANKFVDKAYEHLNKKYRVAERHTQVKDIDVALRKCEVDKRIADLDGDVFFIESLRNDELELEEQPKQELIISLTRLHKALLNSGMKNPKPSPFYALLLMDGDGMGKLLASRSSNERKQISLALAEFSQAVPDIVKNHNGKLVYAGGDDVFALMPLDSAIDCASLCRSAYRQTFERQASFVSPKLATISAAINYAHMNTALGVVVRDSHRLLDDIAKDKTGRNAIACRIWKRGGPILTWTQPWELAENGGLIRRVKEAFQNDSGDADRFSSKFFYKLRDLFELVQDEVGNCTMNDGQIQALLVAEYLATREHRWDEDWTQEQIRRKARERIEFVLKLCRETVRELTTERRNGKTCEIEAFCPKGYKADGALLVRFLVQKEV